MRPSSVGNMFSGKLSHAVGYGDLSIRRYGELCLRTMRTIGSESFFCLTLNLPA